MAPDAGVQLYRIVVGLALCCCVCCSAVNRLYVYC